MSHAPKTKNISDYNTFRVFDEIYGQDKQTHFDELERPEPQKSHGLIMAWLLLLLIIFSVGAGLHPLASYFLKTPYPLVAVGSSAMAPTLQMSDLVLIEGVPSPTLLQPEDVVVYSAADNKNNFFIERVIAVTDEKLVVKGDALDSTAKNIYAYQLVGRVITLGHSVKLPLMNALKLLAQR